jgi:hypothetical protein
MAACATGGVRLGPRFRSAGRIGDAQTKAAIVAFAE